MDPLIADLLKLADIYGVAAGLSEGTVSDRVLHGANRMRDLRAGDSDIGVKRLRSAVQWFSDHWPEGVRWPRGVERPAQTPHVVEPAS